MENINFEHKKGKGFHITDFQNAEKVVALQGEKARKLADMALHRSDLLQAEKYLDMSVNAEDTSDIQRALWKMAIITFTKCFGKNNARTERLDIKQIIPEDTLKQEHFAYFRDLRDKNIAHDDSPVNQCLVGAVINKKDAPHKIEKIVTMTFSGEMGGEENLRNLIKISHRYVEERYDKLCVEITEELAVMSHNELVEIDKLVYQKPGDEDVHKNRKKITFDESNDDQDTSKQKPQK